MNVGVDYYPEHWDVSLWEQDARQMREAGITIVRLAEFAWSRLEPTEGEFDFEWLDQAIAVLARHEIGVVIGTPTATPPVWLTHNYPDVLPVDNKGNAVFAGVRLHRCYSSPSLRKFGERIIEQTTRRYASHPAVIGWQTDNELAANDCHCANCTRLFRGWLQKKYGSLETLNREWGTVVWSGEYSDWDQVTTPLGGSPYLNPSFLLDFRRFSSDAVAEFNRFQAALIRQNSPGKFVTHNLWGYPVSADYYDMFGSMDFASVDYYPATDLQDDSKSKMYHGALTLDLTRGVKRQNFWVMEQLSGTPGCWYPMSRTPFPGMIRAYAWQSVSRGADTIIQFRWRSARIGAEQFWHGLLDHHGQPGRRFEEFVQFSTEARKLAPLLEGTTLKHDVAMLFSHEQSNAFQIQPQADGFDYLGNIKRLHSALLRMGVGTDVVNWREDFQGYKFVIAPMLYLIDEEITGKLKQYVENGGVLVLTTRSGVKNLNNVCLPDRLPNLLTELAGAYVDEYDPVGKDSQTLRLESGECLSCGQWCDILTPVTAETTATYSSEYFTGKAAVTRNAHGKGVVYYIGTVLDERASQVLMRRIARDAGIDCGLELPDGVEVAIRQSDERRLIFVLNLSKESKEVSIPIVNCVSALSGSSFSGGNVKLAPGGVEILVQVPSL
ncbi:beta-galactosidase [Paraburkholderia sp. NMBU_R16]|uniref:beta-galactosidase n=1 Tax=Paraburkholderia sp. NMBU_R16 TaxID=2698676 RepID=UPI00156651BE|nr:beta-galactosidase [Paraburkholderia sp. NMBU_R16]NRO95143.1 beta-galactosidase [Paraburkholderia sp. NMBU_R16]